MEPSSFTKAISDGLVDAIAKGQDLGDTLRDAATQWLTGMAKANMDAAFKQMTSALGGGGGGGTGGGGGGGFMSGVGGFLGRMLGFNSGGLISGGSGRGDDVPTLLTDGEFVIRRSAVEKYGAGFLENLNTGRVGQMARGGRMRPGTYGQGAITGKEDLLDFATQSFTTGQFDRLRGGAGFGSVALEPLSGRLTRGGSRGPSSQRELQSMGESLGLHTRQTQYEDNLKKEEKRKRRSSGNR